MAAGTPDDFLRAHLSNFQGARIECVVSNFCFVCSLAQQLKVVTARYSSGDFQAFVRYRKKKNVQSCTLVMQVPIWLFRGKLRYG